MVQANMVRDGLAKVRPDLETEIVTILTSGDWKSSDGEVRLSSKELFTKEIEQALLDGTIDCAVHSMKDVDSHMPEGLVVNHVLPREDVRDCLLFSNDLREKIESVSDIPEGAVIGTASVRRQAYFESTRPDLKFEVLRGNVGTRIEKVRGGQVDATFLAMAGLKRLGLEGEVDLILEPEACVPAACQGIVGIQTRESDDRAQAYLSVLNCQKTLLVMVAERAVLNVIDGDCHTPIGVYGRLDGRKMHIQSTFYMIQNGAIQEVRKEAVGDVESIAQAVALGEQLGQELLNA